MWAVNMEVANLNQYCAYFVFKHILSRKRARNGILSLLAPRVWAVHYDWSDGQHSLVSEVNVTVFKIALSVDYLLNWQFDVETLIFVTPPRSESFMTRFLFAPREFDCRCLVLSGNDSWY